MNTQQTILIILGLGKDEKPRAARFDPADTETAAKAAGLMDLRIGRAETPDAIALAKDLPEGKIFATGKSLMPLMRREVYEKLLKAVTLIDPRTLVKPDTASQAATPAKPSPSNPWDAIEVGSVVLWRVDPKEGFYEALVTAVSKDRKKLTLNWRDFNGFKPFEVKRNAVGLICRVE